jgi:hypothetical protein
MTGFSATSIAPSAAETVVAFVAFAIVVAIAYRQRFASEGVDLFLLLAAIITVVGLFAAPTAYIDTSYFAAPFLFGLLGVSVGRLGPSARRWLSDVRISSGVRRLVASFTALIGAVLIVAMVLFVTTFYSVDERIYATSTATIAEVTTHIPKGSCVVYSEVGVGVLANRLTSRSSHCPDVVDPFGMSMAWGYELTAPVANFVSQWKTVFEDAKYVVGENSLVDFHSTTAANAYRSLIPWNPSLTTWFSTNYHLVYRQFALYIYEKNSKT